MHMIFATHLIEMLNAKNTGAFYKIQRKSIAGVPATVG
jgi:hypothetical protein